MVGGAAMTGAVKAPEVRGSMETKRVDNREMEDWSGRDG